MISKLILSLVKRWLTKEALEILMDKLIDKLVDEAIDAVERLLVKWSRKLAENKQSIFTRELADSIEKEFN